MIGKCRTYLNEPCPSCGFPIAILDGKATCFNCRWTPPPRSGDDLRLTEYGKERLARDFFGLTKTHYLAKDRESSHIKCPIKITTSLTVNGIEFYKKVAAPALLIFGGCDLCTDWGVGKG